MTDRQIDADAAPWDEQRFLPQDQRVANDTRPISKYPRINTNELMDLVFAPILWCVPDYVPEGFSVLAGRQKLGKTWLAIDWAVSCASGGSAMGGVPCEQGDVLYIDLENGRRRAQDRINILFRDAQHRPDLARLQWQNDAPYLGNGLLESLEDWRTSVALPRLVIIDVLQRVKPTGSTARNAYENDYAIFAELQRWALEHAVAVVGLHHTRKGGADDPLEALSGSNGLSACADTTLVLDRDAAGTSLYVRGRDVLERKSALKFLGGQWFVTGDAADVTASTERGNTLRVLLEAGTSMSPSEVASVTGMKPGNVRKLLFSLAKAGEVRKTGYGRYLRPTIGGNSEGKAEGGNTSNTSNTSPFLFEGKPDLPA